MTEDDTLFRQLKRWFKADRDHSADWRKEAKEDFGFLSNEQWSEEDKNHLKAQMRPMITFNRIHPVVQSISGMEIGNRQETRYIPREMGDAKANELLTEANRWFRDNADADDEDSDAFLDSVVCGMGWTETTLDYDQDEEGAPKMDAVSPLEMFWDKNARKKNVDDATRLFRVRKIPMAEAKRLFPDASLTDFDAKWTNIDGTDEEDPQDREEARLYEGEGENVELWDDNDVTIVHAQWFEYVDEHTVVDPMSGQRQKMAQADFEKFSKRAKQVGLPIISTKRKKRVVKQAFLGGKVLEKGDALCPEHFSFRCVTAYRDKNKGTFYGLVRQMKDPQRWANKWMSQALDIINSQAKGGIMMESDAVDDMREFQRDWTAPNKPAVFNPGALSQQKVQPKPQTAVPAAFFQMMEFAISSVRDVSGVSVEMLGMREAGQAASLEYQRRQAGMQILLPLMDNLKRYRRDHGRLMLYLIQHYLSDGRLVRIVGEERTQFVPLMRQADVKYDIVVDDMPTSPNQKEMIASQIAPMMPNLPPPVQMEFMKYLLPDSVGEDMKKIMEKMNQPNPKQEMGEQLQMQGMEAKVQRDRAEADAKRADAAKTQAEIQLLPVTAQKEAAETETERYEAKGQALENVARMAGLLAPQPMNGPF